MRDRSVVKCGANRILWYYPTGLAFQAGATPRAEYEIAPTRWKDAADIHFEDPRLHWFPFVENSTKLTLIPIDKLW